MVKRKGAVVMVQHAGTIKPADINGVRSAPKPALDKTTESFDEDAVGKYNSASSSANVKSKFRVLSISAKPRKTRRIEAQVLAEESKTLTECLPEKRVVRHEASHMISMTGKQAVSSPQIHLFADEKRISYQKENDGWGCNHAFERLPKSDVPRGTNIFGPHVVYRFQSGGTAKVRILPREHRDI